MKTIETKYPIEIKIPKYVAYKGGKLAGFYYSVKQLQETLNEKSSKIKDYIEKKTPSLHGYLVSDLNEDVRDVLKKYKSNIESEGLRKTDLFIEFVNQKNIPDKDIVLLFLKNIKSATEALAKNNFNGNA